MERRRFALAASIVLLALAACGGGGGGDDGGGSCVTPDSGRSMTTAERNLAQQAQVLASLERTSTGLGGLVWDAAAAEVAFEHSWDMYTRDFFDHTNPCGEDPGDRLAAASISWWTYGENIAQGYSTAAAVVAGWMASAGHRANIMNPSFTRCGVGCFQSPDGNFWTMVLFDPP